jgi:hypothetical protein
LPVPPRKEWTEMIFDIGDAPVSVFSIQYSVFS